MKAVVMPLLGAPEINAAYHDLVGKTAALPGMMPMVLPSAGFGEEFVFRGSLFERLGALWGESVQAKVAIVVFTSALFGIIHYPVQGLAGAEQAAITVLAFATYFAITRRIIGVMIAHAAFDVVAVSIVGLDLESYVAHLVFK